MIGYEFEFCNENGHGVDYEGPVFTLGDVPLQDIKDYLAAEPKGSICITTNEYLGNQENGYDFNAPLRRARVSSIDELKDWINQQ